MTANESKVYRVSLKSVREYSVDVLAHDEKDAQSRAIAMADAVMIGDYVTVARDDVQDVVFLGDVRYADSEGNEGS